ncbi:uncharacterized protein LOC135836474 [Planococcus citri]|uniref:uncharacterized protein LOC135836474 n=1 Tax=Planococcus citri TaxID=170843 RepID=UPI0031F7D020
MGFCIYDIRSCFCFSLRVGTLITLYLVLLVNILLIPVLKITFSSYPEPLNSSNIDNGSISETSNRKRLLVPVVVYLLFTVAQSFALSGAILCFHCNLQKHWLGQMPLLCSMAYELMIPLLDFISIFKAEDKYEDLCSETRRSEEVIGNPEFQKVAEMCCELTLLLFCSDMWILRIVYILFVVWVLNSYFHIEMMGRPARGLREAFDIIMGYYVNDEETDNDVPASSDQRKENVASKVSTRYKPSGYGFRIPGLWIWIWCVKLTRSKRVESKRHAKQKISVANPEMTPV